MLQRWLPFYRSALGMFRNNTTKLKRTRR